MPDSVWRLRQEGTKVAVLADCHIGENGARFPAALLARLQGADLIVTLGGMGERSSLDQLEEIAPVLGVQAPGDPNDMRTRRSVMVLSGEGYRIGCVADAVAAGLAVSTDPFVAADDVAQVCRRLFGGRPDLLLHAGGRKAQDSPFGLRGSALNPGSPVRPVGGSRPSFLRLKVTLGGCYGQIVWAD